MKPQRRGEFNQECGYLKAHGSAHRADAGEAMLAFLAKGGKITRVKPVKGDQRPSFNAGYPQKRGRK